MVGEMKKSIPMVAALTVITASFLTACSSTSNPTSSSSSQVRTSTESPTVQTPTTVSTPATSSTAPTTSANTSAATCQTGHLTLAQGRVGAAAVSYTHLRAHETVLDL